MTSFWHNMVNSLPYVRNLRKQLSEQGAFPPGHFYSPTPNAEEVRYYVNSLSKQAPEPDLPDIALNTEKQFQLLKKFSTFYYPEIPFPEKETEGFRYYFDQPWFGYADAIYLYSFLRSQRPKRIIEVGSGFSSAVMLDTVDRFPFSTEFTFIDPFPERLQKLLKPSDRERAHLFDRKVQDVPFELFLTLEPGDLLFIDSSHVLKAGSDLQYLMFRVLPHLPVGVFVHFHDIFFPFEYPQEWLLEGRYWNENYMLRAFLSGNPQWEIFLFNDYVKNACRAYIEQRMPLCMKNTGGSLYLRRVAASDGPHRDIYTSGTG